MEHEMKLALGRIIGNLYKIQREQGVNVSEAKVFGLLNGFQEEIDNELDNLEFYSNEKINLVCDELDPYYKHKKKLDEMPDYLQFRMAIENKYGIKQYDLNLILKYLRSKDRYNREIDRLGNFKLTSYDIEQ